MIDIHKGLKVFYFFFLYLFFQSSIYCQQNQSAAYIFRLSNQLLSKAVKEYNKKDFNKSAEFFEQALKIRPSHPSIMYNLASVNALSGYKSGALEMLHNIAGMNLVFHPETDSDFVSLWENNDFHAIIQRFRINESQIGRTSTAFILKEKDLITEGVFYYPKTKRFYVSSVHKCKIISIDEKGNAGDFITSGQDSIWAIFGLAIDTANGILWASTSAIRQMINYNQTDSGKAGVFKYDLNSGKLIKKYILSDEEDHLFGDLTLGTSGDVYISDSRNRAIYVISKQKDQLELFLKSDDFISPQGLTLSDNNTELYFADYAFGIYKINLASLQTKKLDVPDSICLLGIDGIYFYNNSLIAVQNGTNPYRVVRLFLDNDHNGIESYKILAANNHPMEDPTLGVIVNNIFYFIANSQWNKVENNGTPLPYEKWDTPTVLKTFLDQ